MVRISLHTEIGHFVTFQDFSKLRMLILQCVNIILSKKNFIAKAKFDFIHSQKSQSFMDFDWLVLWLLFFCACNSWIWSYLLTNFASSVCFAFELIFMKFHFFADQMRTYFFVNAHSSSKDSDVYCHFAFLNVSMIFFILSEILPPQQIYQSETKKNAKSKQLNPFIPIE